MAVATDIKAVGIRTKLLKTLSQVNRPGNFCSSGDRPIILPGLEIEGIGSIGLPLSKSQACRIIKLCHQAPYGKGTETVVDTDVRKVWELDALQIALTNPKWDDCIDSIIDDVKKKLGLEQQKLDAHLYKLLVYEKDSFFLPHRDGEKLDGMVATLVVVLPSVFEGGDLTVTHDGQKQTVKTSGAASGFELSFAAFYADCKHEVRPVTSGYRICLSYNITLKNPKSKAGITAPCYRNTSDAIAKLLNTSLENDTSVKKLAVTLDHRYTQDGLTVDRLKGIDRARAEVIFEAAENAGFVAHLALLTWWLSGSMIDDYYGNGDNDYGDHESDDTVSNREIDEVIDDSLSANHWIDRNGKIVMFGEMLVEEDEVISQTPMEDWDVSREEFEGYTGNAGMTLERWYHRAAIVLWPKNKHFEVLTHAGTDNAIGGLQVMIKKLKRVAIKNRDALHKDCITFATAIIDSWQPVRNYWGGSENHVLSVDREEFSSMLSELDNCDLVQHFIANVLTQDTNIGLENSCMNFFNRHGWKNFEKGIEQVLQKTDCDSVTRNTQLIAKLCVGGKQNSARTEICGRLCESAVASLISFDTQIKPNDWEANNLERSAILASLVKAMLSVDSTKTLRQLLNHALAATEVYEFPKDHLAAIFSLKISTDLKATANQEISRWLESCRVELANRTAKAPVPPPNFCREHKISCKCADCRTLSEFLANPDEKQIRLPLAKDRRQHLHRVIDGNHCDLTHVTERKGRPFTLVCTKTEASFKATCLIHKQDKKNLAQITKLLKLLE